MNKAKPEIVYDVFISYASVSRDWVKDELIPRLKDEKINFWWDGLLTALAVEDWRVEIDQAIRESKTMLVVMTPTANKSKYVTFEWSYALGLDKTVLICLREETEDIHPRLMTKQFMKMLDNVYNWGMLIEELTKAIKQSDDQLNDVLISQNELMEVLLELLLSRTLEPLDLRAFKSHDLITREEQKLILKKLSDLQKGDESPD